MGKLLRLSLYRVPPARFRWAHPGNEMCGVFFKEGMSFVNIQLGRTSTLVLRSFWHFFTWYRHLCFISKSYYAGLLFFYFGIPVNLAVLSISSPGLVGFFTLGKNLPVCNAYRKEAAIHHIAYIVRNSHVGLGGGVGANVI